jgi:hypothetical protein
MTNGTERQDALVADGLSNEYALAEGQERVWIRVGGISVQVVRTDTGVVVDLYGYEAEDVEPLASTWATFDDAEGCREASPT